MLIISDMPSTASSSREVITTPGARAMSRSMLAFRGKMSATNLRTRRVLAVHERAAAFRQRPERLIGRDGGADLEVVPPALRFRRLLHLDQIHRVDLAAVGAHRALAE